MKDVQDIHKNHRMRMKNRYINSTYDSFSEHELLEMLLFYSIPRSDTNPTAHLLIDSFGSLSDVFSAPFEALLQVNGIGENSAMLIKLVGDFCSIAKKPAKESMFFSDYDYAGRYLTGIFSDDTSERVIMLMLDAKNRLLNNETVCEGDFSSARVNVRTIVKEVIFRNAAKVILAHNHPDGNPNPSVADKAVTVALENVLSEIGVELKEHYIIADNVYVGMKHVSLENVK